VLGGEAIQRRPQLEESSLVAWRLASSSRSASAWSASGKRMGKASGCVLALVWHLCHNGASVPTLQREWRLIERRLPDRCAPKASLPGWEVRLLTGHIEYGFYILGAYTRQVTMSTVKTPEELPDLFQPLVVTDFHLERDQHDCLTAFKRSVVADC
jgi:hypothetical protein